jgi:arginine N-succinyltransferase
MPKDEEKRLFVVRPVTEDDLAGMLLLADQATFGLTTLPLDREVLSQRIRASKIGFEKVEGEKPAGESFLFALEDASSGRLAGVSGIVSKVGGFEPFYAYKIENSIHESEMLGARKEVDVLHLVAEHNGPCEIGSLFVHPDYRRHGVGRLISLARFLFIADHPGFFDPMVIAELRGVVDDEGQSPLWEALGRHFFDLEYAIADYLSIKDKQFIADLMPKHPIYIPILPKPAQEVIGRVHPKTRPARKLLEGEGFGDSGMVDIFEGGPILRCPRDEIRSIRESSRAPVVDLTDSSIEGHRFLVSNAKRDFRAVSTEIQRQSIGVVLTQTAADALGVKKGDTVRFAAERPNPPPDSSPTSSNET